MLFQDLSCMAQNSLTRNHDAGLYSMTGTEWVAIVTLTRKLKIYVDGYLNLDDFDDNCAFSFLEHNKEKLLLCQNEPYKTINDEENYFAIIPIRQSVNYVVFHLYCKRKKPFGEHDLKWARMYANLAYHRVLLENQLVQDENIIDNVFESTNLAIAAFDLNGKLVKANSQFMEQFKFEDSNFNDKCIKCIVFENYKDFAKNAINVAVSGNKINIDECLYKIGTRNIIMNITVSPLRDSKNRIAGIVLVCTDITNHKFIEHELNQMKQYGLVGEVSLGLAHDIKNPLTNIRGCASYLKRGIGVHSDKSDILDIIIHEADRINGVIEQMLSFGNIGKENKYSMLDINEVLFTCIQIIERQKLFKDINVKYNLQEKLPLIKVNRVNMQQVFLNILINSIQSIDKSGFISITSELIENAIKISIQDNGKGIPEDEKLKLFNPYNSTKPNGTGLGLYMVKRVLEQYNGRIIIESTQGKGTNCIVFIPLLNLTI